ncbi:porin [Noviherbaspirillum saxi]|uniref:porin n=1 Tax=Noviherbaspirillum saxi TaxID=2320863 RepID=UPI0013149BD4|nr:porin [Noviherbaspirillum saxi]
MKKTIMVLAFLSAASTAAIAQSNLQLYGRLDVVVDSVRFKGTPNSVSVTDLSTDTSYWGVRGREDLGAGLKAFFKLESGFSVDTGAQGSATQFFNREAYVGMGGNFGSVQLGSQYTPALWITTKVDPFQRSANGAIFNLMQQNGGNRQRGYLLLQNNALQYVSPDVKGFSARAMLGLSEQTAAPRDVGEFRSASIEYSQGAFYGGFSIEDLKIASTPAGAAWSNKTVTLGATYDLRTVKLYGYLLKNTLTNSRDAEGYMLGLTYPVGAGTVRASYSAREVDGIAGSKASVMALGYTYDLSKRTTLYTSYALLDNGAASNMGLWPSSKTHGLPATGQDVRSIEAGIRHFF